MTHVRTGFRNRLVCWLSTLALTVICPVGAMAQSTPKADFDIAPQTLEAALQQAAQVQRVQILYSENDVKGLTTPGVKGKLSTYEAVQKLIEGTGLSAVANQNNAIAIKMGEKGGQAANPTILAQASSAERRESPPRDQAPLGDQKAVRGEGIVVTAQKRNELLIDVPQSVSVLSGEALSRMGALQFRDFANLVPGMAFTTFGAGYTQVTLRGLTTGVVPAPTVGIYLDDVPYGSSTTYAAGSQYALDVGLFDMERVEVLRGPQGTLYGVSTMGGLLKYVGKRPDVTRFSLEARAGISDTRHGGVSHNLNAALNVPVSDNVALRASAFESRDGGYIDNVALGHQDVNRSDIRGGRLDLLAKPVPALSVRLGAFVQNIEREGMATADYSLAGQPLHGDRLSQSRQMVEPFDQRFRLASGILDYQLGSATLTSVSSYQTALTQTLVDLTRIYIPLLALPRFGSRSYSAAGIWVDTDTDKFTQEIRLASDTGRRMEWLIGGYYSDEKSRNTQFVEARDLAGRNVPNDIFFGEIVTDYEDMAAFGTLTFHWTDKFDTSGGVRLARNRTSFVQDRLGVLVGATQHFGPRSMEDRVTTYLANARYRPSESMTAYARFATGYRPGGPNSGGIFDPVTGQALAPLTFGPDTLKSYEVGLKAESPSRAYSFDLSAYHIDWQDIQLVAIRNGFGVIANAGKAISRGAELAVIARPMSVLTLSGAFGLQDARLSGDAPDLGGRDKERLPDVPRFTAAVNVDYDLPWAGLRPTIGGTIRHVTERKSGFGAAAYVLPEYTTVDLRAGFMLGRLNVQLFARNLFDKVGQLSAFTGRGRAEVALLQPRTIGMSIAARF